MSNGIGASEQTTSEEGVESVKVATCGADVFDCVTVNNNGTVHDQRRKTLQRGDWDGAGNKVELLHASMSDVCFGFSYRT